MKLYIAIFIQLILFNMLSYTTVDSNDLFIAIDNDNIGEVIRLINSNAHIEVRNEEKDTPLLYAVIEGKIPLVKILLQHGANINAQEERGHGVLHLASYSTNSDALAEMLLRYGANTELKDEDGNTPLIYATQINDIPLVKTLLQHGADMYAKNNEGKSAFDYANEEIMDLLRLYASAPTTKGALIN